MMNSIEVFIENSSIDLMLALIFVIYNDILIFKKQSIGTRIWKGLLVFLSSNYVLQLSAYILWNIVVFQISKTVELTTTQFLVIMAMSELLMYPIFIRIYKTVTGASYYQALCLYSLLMVIDNISMVLSFYSLYTLYIVIAMMLIGVYAMFHKEMKYMLFEARHQFEFAQILTWYLIFIGTVFGVQVGMIAVYSPDVDYRTITFWLDVVGFSFYFAVIYVMLANLRTRRLYEENQVMRYSDDFTGCYNYDYYKNYGGRRMKRFKAPVLLYFDIDYFNTFNERFGFVEGDMLLLAMKDQLQEEFKGADIYRFHVDHFGVLCEDENLYEHLDAMQDFMATHNKNSPIKLKVGVYRVDIDSYKGNMNTEEALKIYDGARNACLEHEGKNEVYITEFNKEFAKKEAMNQYIVNHFKEALEKHKIKVVFQPVLDLEINKVVCFEILTRWDDETYGVLLPEQFIKPLEKARLVHLLDEYVLKYICRSYTYLKDENLGLAKISMNLSIVDFDTVDMFELIDTIVEEAGVPKSMLCFEIEERVLTSTSDRYKNIINHFRYAGYEIWIDEFGEGASSLNVLTNYEFNGIKVQIDYLQDFDQASKAVITTIQEGGYHNGFDVVLSGVETLEQVEQLKKLGVRYIQGYWIAKPDTYIAIYAELKERNIPILEHSVR